MRNVRVRLFARCRDVFGVEEQEVELPEIATVKDLRVKLVALQPTLSALIERSRIAVNGEFAGESDPIATGDEIAVIPPVSGG